jgi:hypothetical protein
MKDSNLDEKELRTKLGLCRTRLAYLQTVFDNYKLSTENPSVRADFRHLVIALMWVAFHARKMIDFRTFRMLVRVESGFTYPPSSNIDRQPKRCDDVTRHFY